MGKPEALSYDDKKMAYIDLGSAVIRMEQEEPPQWALEIAQKELRETPEVVEEAMKKLRELIQGEQYLWDAMYKRNSVPN